MSTNIAKLTDPSAFGKVAVLMGGWSAEREISLLSGKAVHQALCAKKVDAYAIDVSRENLLTLRSQGFDRVFNIVHGTGGEDGVLRAVMEVIQMPCTGAAVLASALAMDKLRSKAVWKAEGLPTPAYIRVNRTEDLLRAAEQFGFPFILKPACEGSSVGISKVKSAAQFAAALALARGEANTVMAEEFVDSGVSKSEFTCAVLADRALPLVRIDPDGEFYDYHAKYVSDRTRYHCPSGLDAETEVRLQALCLQAFRSLGATGWGRIDFMLDAQNRPWLIEANLVPGMTSHSLVPMAARQAGMDFPDLCWAVLETSLPRSGPADE